MFWIAPLGAVLGLAFAWLLFRQMVAQSPGNETMQGIARDVRTGAFAYLFRQYKVVGWVFAAMVVLLTALSYAGIQNPFVPLAFLTGGMFSGLCGFLGMNAATKANCRTAQAASESLNRGLKVAFKAGAVMGLVVVGFGLLDIAAWYLFLDSLIFTPEHFRDGLHVLGLTLVHQDTRAVEWLLADGTRAAFAVGAEAPTSAALVLSEIGQKINYVEITTTMLTFGMGASTQALFARVGGGIYTKAADVGSDLVGKVEAGIPEDDPRNPATIADNVGDNVGDVAGMGADLYESYCGSIVATAALGAALPMVWVKANDMTMMQAVTAPMVVAGIGIVLSLIGIYMVRTKEDATQKDLLRSLLTGTLGSSILILAAVAGLAAIGYLTWGIFGAITAGLVGGVIIGQSTEYFTAGAYKPTQGIAAQGKMGPATVIIEGMAVGMYSTWIPVVTVVAATLIAYGVNGGFTNMSTGLYGVSFAAVGMLATLGITLATDAYGPIADNAGGCAEMSGLPPQVRERTDALDALGNTTAATGKGFAIGSAALTALALVASYIEELRIWLGRYAEEAPAKLVRVGHDFFFRSVDSVEAAGETARTLVEQEVGQPVTAEAWAETVSHLNALSVTALDTATLVEQGVTSFQVKAMIPGTDYYLVRLQDAGIPEFMLAFDVSLMNPMVVGGLFIGAMMAMVFCAMTMKAVGRAAGAMVEEVRRQFRTIVGIMDYKPGDLSPENQARRPHYDKCVEISTAGAQREMILPSLIAIIVPVAVGLTMGIAGVCGLLIGGLASGFALATMLNNAGGAWDNAKKSIEGGAHGGKYLKNAQGEYVDAKGNLVADRSLAKNPIHGAAVIGDTVGDPFKDTSGPSLNILIKLMTMVSVVFSGVVLAAYLAWWA